MKETKMSALPKDHIVPEVVIDHINDIFGKPDDFKVEPAVTEAANEDQPTNGKTNWFWSWTQSSYEAWDQSGKFDKI
jgi:hypothetical protein